MLSSVSLSLQICDWDGGFTLMGMCVVKSKGDKTQH